MKTSKEMQLKILDKMRENIEGDLALMNSIQYRNRVNLVWDDRIDVVGTSQFERLEMRVKPETITINGVEIPKPLGGEFSVLHNCVTLYFPKPFGSLYGCATVDALLSSATPKLLLVYSKKEEAIEASKLLFGMEG